ncbi:triple tyrosine motif-containing protein [Bacteroides finegoldii]|uniref:helix-turn-helix and ligand-binding sensor domain-containing protein n=1 Tax=Bacteroides finegoldii TaxID=338188 RepID=UPI00189746BD|nr:triple tyrosine motif-containing protein [Bacteroides finegoldii]
MKYCWIFLWLCILPFACITPGTAQTPVQITNYNYKNYKGGIQNWGITISSEQILYSSNNNGLLRYNGNDWTLLEPDERSTVRAVRCIGNRVYTAGDNNIGYWEYDTNGKIIYTSLLPLVNKLGMKGETFWSIGETEGKVYFHSFGNIICYDGKVMDYLLKNDCCVSLYQVKEKLFTQKCGGALMLIHKGKLETFCDQAVFGNGETKFMFQIADNEYLIGQSDGKIYSLKNNEIGLFMQLENETHIPVRIDCGSIWKDELLAVGTIGDGLFLIDLKNNRQTHYHSSQLQDLNIHGLCFADENSLWLSLDNGISSIILEPATYLWKTNTDIGTFFDAAHFNGKTYVASNQGIYLYEEDGKKIPTSIYPLQFCNLKNELLCGTTTQLFKMTPQRSSFEPFCNINGVRQFEYVADHGDEYIFLRSYSGIALLEYKDNTWKYRSLLMNTGDYASIMPENLHTVWAIHPEKGIYRLRINRELTEVTEFDNFSEIDGYANYNRISLFKVEDKILFATPKGIYQFDISGKNFNRLENISKEILYLDKLQSVKTAYKNDIWVATDEELFLYHIADLSAEPVMHWPFVDNELMLYDKHYNLKSINDSITFVSTCEGTVVINNKMVSRCTANPAPLEMETFCFTDNNNIVHYADFHQQEIELPNTATNITIQVTTGLSTHTTSISYRLPGVTNEWSSWQTSGTIYFTNLPSGSYQLEIKDSNQNSLIIPIVVSPPLYKRTWMIALYVLILLVITAGIVMFISERKRKRLLRKYEEEQKKHAEELQQQAYEQLQEKVKNQESELKNRMRFLTQKQELLDAISTEVEAQKNELGERYPNKLYRRLMKIIQEGATEKDKLLSFENYFVEVHYEFMLRMQKAYPDLSPSELKFCCLIRANLSTKEISVIMGIALRSVELKKYRLKRKLNLEQESSLTSYILTI